MALPTTPNPALSQVPAGYKYGWHDSEMKPLHVMKKGLNADVVEEISRIKGEPDWMRQRRLKAYRHFEERPMPTWGGNLGEIDFQDIYYYVTATDKAVQSWDDVPDYVKRTSTGWASRRPRRSTSPASAASTTPRSCTTTSRPIWNGRA